jgi:hypothetical protein
MGTPKGNQKGFSTFPSGGTFADSGAGVVQTVGQDSKGDQIRVWGRFTTAAGPIVDTSRIVGEGILSIVRGAAGIYTVTFVDGFQACQSASATVQNAVVATDVLAEVSTFTPGVAGACTLRLLTFTGAGAADPAAGDYVCFEAVLCSQWLD